MSILSASGKEDPPTAPRKRANPVIIALAIAIGLVIDVGSVLYLEPQLKSFQPNSSGPRQPSPQQTTDNPIQEVEIPEDLSWDTETLTSQSPAFTAEAHSENAKVGAPKTIEGLETQSLNFGLRSRNGCVWSPDGRVLYAFTQFGVLRIDVPNWQITHRIQFNVPRLDFTGMALTSEGLAVTLRSVLNDERIFRKRDGKAYIRFDRRIGSGKPPEIKSTRLILVLDADDLHAKKQYIGPSLVLAGSPQSPVVCVSDNRGAAKLIDLRDGHVLDTADPRNSSTQQSSGLELVSGFNEMFMSPDGKTLYHYGGYPASVYRTDVSSGKFVGNHVLVAVNQPEGTPTYRPHLFYMSSDGKYLGALNKGKRSVLGYTVIDLTRDSRPDDEEPLLAPYTTSFTFAGPNNRPVGNTTLNDYDNGRAHQTSYHLLFPARTFVGRGFQIYPGNALQSSILIGAPDSDHVLLCAGEAQTQWITLPPPEQSETELAALVVPTRYHSVNQSRRMEFAVSESRTRSKPSKFPKVDLERVGGFLPSPAGDRLYAFATGDSIFAFNAETLRLDRYASLLIGSDSETTLHMTKAGPLLHVVKREEVQLLDGKTLEGKLAFATTAKNLATSPGSDAVALADAQNNLHIYDARTGKSIALVTQKQLDELEGTDAGRNPNDPGLRDIAISADGSILVCCYCNWHVFSLSANGLKPLGVVKPRGSRAMYDGCVASAIPQSGNIYFQDRLKVHCYPVLKEIDSQNPVFRLPRNEDRKALDLQDNHVLAISPTGLIYCRPDESNELRAYNADAKVVYSGPAFDNLKGNEKIAILPNHPERVFVIDEHSVHVADLKPSKAAPGK